MPLATVNDSKSCQSAAVADTVPGVPTYGLTELAEAVGVPARTVRYYQATGLLQKPRRSGRQAVYNDAHLDRLHQIADLRARGLKLEGIRKMLQAGANGEAPAVALLGSEALSERWLAEATRTFDTRESPSSSATPTRVSSMTSSKPDTWHASKRMASRAGVRPKRRCCAGLSSSPSWERTSRSAAGHGS